MTDLMFAAVKWGRLAPGMTRPSAHLPFGYSRHPNGGILHRVDHVVIDQRQGQTDTVGAKWKCGTWAIAKDAVLLDLADWPDGYASCAACDVHDLLPHGPVVYALLCWVDGERLIKVGYSSYLPGRLTKLPGDLLGAKTGDHRLEKVLLAELAPYLVRGREWFSLEALPVIADLLKFSVSGVSPPSPGTEPAPMAGAVPVRPPTAPAVGAAKAGAA